jgi:hypothetical protein
MTGAPFLGLSRKDRATVVAMVEVPVELTRHPGATDLGGLVGHVHSTFPPRLITTG